METRQFHQKNSIYRLHLRGVFFFLFRQLNENKPLQGTARLAGQLFSQISKGQKLQGAAHACSSSESWFLRQQYYMHTSGYSRERVKDWRGREEIVELF